MITIDNIRQHDDDNDCDVHVVNDFDVTIKTYQMRGPNGFLDGLILVRKLGAEE